MALDRERKTEWQRNQRRQIRNSELDFDITPWVVLKDEHPDLFLHILTVRKMIEHRGITVRKGFGGRSYQYWYKALSPHVNTSGVYKDNMYNPEKKHTVLYELEDLIGTITEERGGLLATCGCTPDAIEMLKDYISRGIHREDFPDA